MTKKKSIFKDWKTWVCFIPVFLGMVFLVYVIVLANKESHTWLFKSLDDFFYSQMKENFGEFISGTVGILFTLTATFFLFVSMAEQRQQMYEARQDNQRSRYESTYFNMLAMLDNVMKSVETSIKMSNSRKIESINDYYLHIKYEYVRSKKTNAEMSNLIQEVLKKDSCSYQVQKLKESTAKIFEEAVKELNCNVGYFYRYIYNAIMYVEETNIVDDAKKKQYLNILKAQLSDEALALIMYDAISKFGQNKDGFNKFRDVLDRLNFLENIQESVLLERCHYRFYPRTVFRFLNADETKRVQKEEVV